MDHLGTKVVCKVDSEPTDSAEAEIEASLEEVEAAEASEEEKEEEKTEEREETIPVEVPLEGIRLIAPSALGSKESVALRIEPIPAEASLDGLTFAYATTKAKYVTVNASGVICGGKTGTATITVTASNGMKSSATVSVKAAPKSISLSAVRTVLGEGETTTTKYSLSKNSAGGIQKYTTSDENVVTIDANGNIRAIGIGTAQVSAWTYNNKISNAVMITVKNAPTTIVPEKDAIKIGAGDSCLLGYALGENEAGAVTFASADPAIAEVDGSGRIKAIAKGSATITLTAYNGAASAACAVEVTDAPEKIALFGNTTLGVGEYAQFTHEIEPAGVVSTVTYTSSKTKCVTVAQDGRIYGR
ncbi:MAG: Ig-like domain-containing protein, partial [Oscillospiraceae bacterium]|nr:Ig-like domain-containing protein [Oscillospiraceae bacterium]